jgi:hypothetical protein
MYYVVDFFMTALVLNSQNLITYLDVLITIEVDYQSLNTNTIYFLRN